MKKRGVLLAIPLLMLILSTAAIAVTSDINGDGIVNPIDFAILGLYWQQNDCDSCGNADINGDGNVDIYDLKEMTDDWLIYSEPLDSPLGAWMFDDGTADDSSGNNHNGILSGNAKITVDAKRNNVLNLDGSGDYVNIPGNIGSFASGQVTVCAWVNPDSVAGTKPMVDKAGIFSYTITGGKQQFAATGNGVYLSSSPVIPGGWQHIAVVFTASASVKFYRNGMFISQTTVTSLNSSIGSARIGADIAGSYYFDGLIDDVKVYDYALTDEKIHDLANEYKCIISGRVADVAAMYDMDNVTMSGLPGDPVTDANGDYRAMIDNGWSGIVTPQKEGYVFSPTERIYSNVTSNQANQNYIPIKVTAENPSPADGAINISVNQEISWTTGPLANPVGGQNVYFGTDFDAVNSRDESVFKGNQSAASYGPGTLAGLTTYYWAIDTVNDGYADSPWAGAVWSFTTIDADLVGYWKLNEGSGTIAADHSGHNNNGTINGAEWANDGVMGQVLKFSGVDYITIPSVAFSSISNQVTIALWQYGDASLPVANSIFYGANASNYRVLNAHVPWSSGSITFDAGHSGSGDSTNTNYDRISKTADSDNQYKGQWNHWAFTKNTTTGLMKIYLNGQLWSSGTGKTKSMTDITQFKIGSKYDGTSNYPGMIFDFRVYSKELSQTAINNLYIASMRYEASNPSPADDAENVPTDAVLSWTAGYLAGEHKVYFGTNLVSVTARDPSVFKGSQSGTTYDPGTLQDSVVYYWAVDEVNDLASWAGAVWSFTASDNSGLPPMPNDVKCNNTHLMHGNIRGVAFPINWQTVGCSYTQAQIANTCGILHENWDEWSRGKVQMVGRDGTGTQFTTLTVDECAVPYEKKSSNETLAHQYLGDLHNIPDSTIKWFINSGNSGANSGGTTCDTYSMQVFTVTHELGHLFRLGHGVLLLYNSDGTYNGTNNYGDRTTNEGSVAAGGWNLPNYHRLKWIEEDEVAVFKKENSGTVYRIREIQKVNDTVNWAGVVYYMPVTGNRMWISVTHRGGDTYGNKYLGNQLALTKYVNGWHMNSSMQSTFCIKHMVGAHTDEFGLTYEVVAIDTSANRAWADIRITYNSANDICNKPLVFKQTQKLLQAATTSQHGKMEVTIEVTNPNLPTTTPCLQQRATLSVPNDYSTTTDIALPGIIPGGTTAKAVYTVQSKLAPLTPANSHLTGSFQVAHLYPFEFAINFE